MDISKDCKNVIGVSENMPKSEFYRLLNEAQIETRDVQPRYIDFLKESLNKKGNLNSTYEIPKTRTKADGLVSAFYMDNDVANKFLIILECKLDQSLENDAYRSGVILQVLCYLKQMKDLGEEIPRIALIGNKEQCFVLPISCIQKYIDKEIKNYKTASKAHTCNSIIIDEIMKDDEITKHCNLYDITPDFTMDTVAKEIISLAKNQPLKLEIEEHSISRVFDYFTMHILKKRKVGYNNEEVELDPRIQKDLFMTMLLNPDECFLHPNKQDIALFGENNQRLVNRSAYIAFKNSYEFKYSLEEKRKFTEICDRLIEDAERRNKGDFYTPTVWVDEAHKMLNKELGENWRDEYIVWDCCCGTKNLTRDYKFKQLYCSTIEQGDIEIGKRYNLDVESYHSVSFQYDFLNDDVELFEKLLEKKKSGVELTELDFVDSLLYLKAAGLIRGLLLGKSLVFLINPPYGTAGNQKLAEEKRTGTAKNKINQLMLKDKIGASSQQLYAQFLYRIGKFKDLFGIEKCQIALYSTFAIQGSPSFKGLRKYMGERWVLNNGMIFPANQFAGCSDSWGVMFSIWRSDLTPKVLDSFPIMVKELNDSMEVEDKGYKNVYNLDNSMACSDWIKQELKKLKTEDGVQLKSALNWNKEKKNGSIVKESIGYFHNDSNMIEKNSQFIFLLTSCAAHGHGFSIVDKNFEKCVSYFTARRLLIGYYSTWVNGKDEYMIPNIEHKKYKEFENDSIVYSLFNTASNQSSLRSIFYNNKFWDIKNEFFFMSEQEIKDLANGKLSREDINDDIVIDIENFGGNRFVYKKLQEIELSEEAQKVLDKAKELVRLSFKNRNLFNQLHSEYQINCWDAGWYQIKGLLKEFHKEELDEFNKLYKKLEDKMRPMVYELGFLKE